MDDELQRYLQAMEGRLGTQLRDASAAVNDSVAAVRDSVAASEARLMRLMNDQHERVINDLTMLRSDFVNTKDFLIRDAATRSRQWLDLEERVSKLERKDE